MKDFLIGLWCLIVTFAFLAGVAWLFAEYIRLFV